MGERDFKDNLKKTTQRSRKKPKNSIQIAQICKKKKKTDRICYKQNVYRLDKL